jgi:hypothetical protein
MWRAGLAGLVALLVCAAPARAVTPTVSTALAGGVTPSFVSSLESPKGGDGPSVIGDGFGINPPTITAAPGGTVTIALDAPVDAVKASFGFTPLPVTPAGERTYTVTLPGDATLPGDFWVRLEYSTETTLGSSNWKLILDAAPAPQPPVPLPDPVGVVADPPAAPLTARLHGRRLSVLMACPARARIGCSGVLTLRAGSVRVARLRLSLAPGTQRTLRTTLSRRNAKRLRHELRAEVAAPDRPLVRTRLPLR